MSSNIHLATFSNGNHVLPPISDVLLSQASSKSYEKDISSQDTFVAGNIDVAEDSDRSSNTRQKIELAINELNMDEASIKDLKTAFSLEEGGTDVASALLRLGQVKKKEHRLQIKYGITMPKQAPYYQPVPQKYSTLLRNNYQRIANPSYHFPTQIQISPAQNRQIAIRRAKEFTSIKIKLRQTEEYWEVLAITLEFEPRQVNMQLVKYPSKHNSVANRAQVPDRDALLIEASKLVLIHSADGSVLEKTVSARSLIPLGGFAKSSALGICQVGDGITRIRILKHNM